MSRLLHDQTLQLQEMLARMQAKPVQDKEAGPAPASLSMALVACRLLAARAAEAGRVSLHEWLGGVADILSGLLAAPGRLSPAGRGALTDLSHALEKILHALDAGVPLARLVDAEFIARQQSRLLELADAPQPRPAAAADLPDASGTGNREPRALLMLGSALRGAEIRARLRDAGWSMLECAGPEEALTELRAAAASFTALICDDLEPEPRLRGLLARVSAAGRAALPPLILAASTGGARMQRHARNLGADGCWPPPYEPLDLLAFYRHGTDGS